MQLARGGGGGRWMLAVSTTVVAVADACGETSRPGVFSGSRWWVLGELLEVGNRDAVVEVHRFTPGSMCNRDRRL